MGMERVTSIMQNKVSNYATDVFGELATPCHEAQCSAMTRVLQIVVCKLCRQHPR